MKIDRRIIIIFIAVAIILVAINKYHNKGKVVKELIKIKENYESHMGSLYDEIFRLSYKKKEEEKQQSVEQEEPDFKPNLGSGGDDLGSGGFMSSSIKKAYE